MLKLNCLPVVIALVALVSRAPAQDRIEGFIKPYVQIELAADEPGVLTAIEVDKGDQVQPDQLLAHLDTTVLESSLRIAQQRAEATGAILAATAERDLKRTYLQQIRRLRSRGTATQRELDRAVADLAVAEARLRMAEEEVALQQLECRRIEAQIARRQIRSPIGGIVAEILHEVGESLSPADPHVMTIVQLDQLRASFPVTARQVRGLERGQEVTLEYEDPAQDDIVEITGKVEVVAPIVDAKSETVDVEIVIENGDRVHSSGLRCWLILPEDGTTTDPRRTRYTSGAARTSRPVRND